MKKKLHLYSSPLSRTFFFFFFFFLDKIGLDIPRGPWQKLNFSVSTEFKSSRILVSIGDILTRHSTASPHETLGHSPPPHLGKETVIRSLTTLVAGSMPALIYRPSLRRGGGIKKWNQKDQVQKYAATGRRRQDKPFVREDSSRICLDNVCF